MIETSKSKKYLMWYKVKKLFEDGLHKSQVGKTLGLHRQTVSKYLQMTEDEFLESEAYSRHYSCKLDAYEFFVAYQLGKYPFLSSAQIHDRLKENFEILPSVTPRTVFNFVNRIRKSHNLPKHSEEYGRDYEMQPETPYGKYAQADFGERWMRDINGSSVKVYFFAMVLSRSRYKYVYFSKTPFTTAKAVYAHELAFEYFGGVPERIIYDQDKVFLVKENCGDLILTKGFKMMVHDIGFEPVFCHKSDPESKGKVENVVKYVKYNFLRGREFRDIESLNKDVLGWLSRTANGMMHYGIRKIPSVVYDMEKDSLMKYNGVPELKEETLIERHVRKDNIVIYKGSYYTVPTGTYHGHNTMVYIEESQSMLYIFSTETGKTIAEHSLSGEKGKLQRKTEHLRDRDAMLNDYEAMVRSVLPKNSIIDDYLSKLRDVKKRNYRDNLQIILKKSPSYTSETIIDGISMCMDANLYNANDLMQVAENIRMNKKEELVEIKKDTDTVPSASTYNIIPDKTDINSFKSIFNDFQ